jgi:hypothetical protein
MNALRSLLCAALLALALPALAGTWYDWPIDPSGQGVGDVQLDKTDRLFWGLPGMQGSNPVTIGTCYLQGFFIVQGANGGRQFYNMIQAALAEAALSEAPIYISVYVDYSGGDSTACDATMLAPTFSFIKVTGT